MKIEPAWLTAISTIVLALAATITVFRDELRRLIHHPDFDIAFTPQQSDCRIVPITWPSGNADAHYIRCRIKNTGKISAQDVEVAIARMFREDASGNFIPYESSVLMNLLWSHRNSHVLTQLPPETERYITLGHVTDPAQRAYIPGGEDDPQRDIAPGKTLFCLETFVRSNTREYLLDPGRYRIVLEVSAANARPKQFAFSLHHTGDWFPDEARMYSQGLGMRIGE